MTDQTPNAAAAPDPSGASEDLDPRLLEILVCPQTKGPLFYDRTAGELVSKKARLAFPIRDGIPIMLIDEARTLTEDEAQRL